MCGPEHWGASEKPMLKIAAVDNSPVATSSALERIAKALGCPVETLAEPSSYDAQTAELMRLWLTIEHEQDRAKALCFLRSIAPTAAAQEDR